MATQFPLPTLGPTITPAGIMIPPYADIYRSLQERMRSIYGADVYIDPDSQDGQMLAIFAQAQYDANVACVSVFNSMSPAKAVGAALSSNVKINGIARKSPTRSAVTVRIVGVVGTQITDGVVADTLSQRWDLPALVVIPSAGEILVTATAQEEGAIGAAPNTITKINTPTLGWQTVNNPGSAVPGLPVETDAELRIRQGVSTTKQAVSVLEAIQAALLDLEGVSRCRVYENDTSITDSDGIPGHHISAVVEGGTPADIAETIRVKKTPGCGTYGTTTVPIVDPLGDTININYFEAAPQRLVVEIEIEPGLGFVTATQDLIKQAVADYINTQLGIGQKVDHGRLFLPAQLYGQGTEFQTFEVNTIDLAIFGGTPSSADVAIAFNEVASCLVSDITITVAP